VLDEPLPLFGLGALVDSLGALVEEALLHPETPRRAVQEAKERQVVVLGRGWWKLDDGRRPVVLAPALDVSGVLGLDGSERASESIR
jgi:hypothetical protein